MGAGVTRAREESRLKGPAKKVHSQHNCIPELVHDEVDLHMGSVAIAAGHQKSPRISVLKVSDKDITRDRLGAALNVWTCSTWFWVFKN